MTDNRISVREATDWQQLPEEWPLPLKKIFAARGIQHQQDLYYSLSELPKPDQLMGMDAAVELLIEAIQQDWHVTIVADFDTDGATSCAVAIRGLRALGLKHVDYIVPNRFEHGYGLTPALIETLGPKQPDLLITVDNGIASHSGVSAAQGLGIKVLITDHHLPGETLPNAEAIVNPNQAQDTFPSKHMAGVGVCFYMLLALRQALRTINWFEQQSYPEPNLMTLMDLVALGTVADVVKLDKLNRTWVSLGLARIRAGKTCQGIKALVQVAGKDLYSCSSTDMGFAIAPRLNAAGRMEDMGIGIETLLTDNPNEALKLATHLDAFNRERREVEQTMQEDALAMLETVRLEQAESPFGYCLYEETWHQGVIGLLASRIKEKQHRPVIAFAPSSETELKGSARSIPGIHIRDVLALVASQAPEILTHFGGHAMAAGLSLEKSHLPQFEQLFQTALLQLSDPSSFEKQRWSDGELAAEEFTLSLAQQLPIAAPWGQGFEPPQFHGVFTVVEYRLVGQQQNHIRLTLQIDQTRTVTAMAFGQTAPDWLVVGGDVLIRFRLNSNEFRDQVSLQLMVDDLLPVQMTAESEES